MFFVKNIALALGVILLALGGVFLLDRQITNMSAAIQKNKELSATLTHRSEVLSQIQKEYGEVSAHEQVIRHALLPTDNILEFTEALDSIAAKYALNPTVSFGSPILTPTTINNGKQTIASIDLGITLSTNLFIFLEYLKDIERLPYFMNIDDIAITARGESGWQGESTQVIHATFYTQMDTPLTP